MVGSSSENMATGNWSQLPLDLINRIAGLLDYVEDLAAFCAVCRSWKSASECWRPSSKQVPWLLLLPATKRQKNSTTIIQDIDNGETGYNLFFSLQTMSPYHQTKINIPKGKDHDDCWGSRHGWLAFSKGERIYLLNPLTEARLHLPPLGETPEKTWVFKAAGGGEDSLLVASVGRNLGLAFLRPGDRAWTHVEKLQNGYKIEDVTLCNGKLFAFRCFDLGPMVMEFESTLGSLEDLYIDIRFEGYSEEGELTQFYLVESGGDLLMVVRLWEWDFCINFEVAEYEGGMDPKTVGFSVYKLDFRMGVWTRLRDLGGIALFVGEKCSFSMAVASNVVVVKPNRIYFAGDRRSFHSPDEVEAAMNDCGIFNMRDSTMEPLFQDDKEFSLFVASSVWFMPSL